MLIPCAGQGVFQRSRRAGPAVTFRLEESNQSRPPVAFTIQHLKSSPSAYHQTRRSAIQQNSSNMGTLIGRILKLQDAQAPMAELGAV
jgi:hypothetical protein